MHVSGVACRRWRPGTHPELVSDLGIWFEFSVIRTTPMTPDQTAMLVLYRIVACHLGVENRPDVRISRERGWENGCGGCLGNRCWCSRS